MSPRKVGLSAVAAVAVVGASVGLGAPVEPGTAGPGLRPAPAEELAAYVRSLDIGGPVSYEGLTLYPLVIAAVRNPTRYETLDEALRQGHMEITETGTVEFLTVVNRSSQPVFILAGEIVTGGKQDRTSRQDVLLPPHSKPVRIPVYCVEKGRWSGVGARFDSPGQLGHLELRRQVQARAPQEAVWKEVSRMCLSLGEAAPGEKFSAVIGLPAVRARQEAILGACAGRFPADTVGLVVCHRGRIVGADGFANPALFKALEHKLLSACALELTEPAPKVLPPPEDLPDVRRFLHTVLEARCLAQETPGAGWAAYISHARVSGTALGESVGLVHMQLFPTPR